MRHRPGEGLCALKSRPDRVSLAAREDESRADLVKFPYRVQFGGVKTSLVLDTELADQVAGAVKAVGEKESTVLRMAVRAGLPIVISRHQAQRPEGYFAADYEQWPKERRRLEKSMSKVKQRPR